jgi:hypothetical protein
VQYASLLDPIHRWCKQDIPKVEVEVGKVIKVIPFNSFTTVIKENFLKHDRIEFRYTLWNNPNSLKIASNPRQLVYASENYSISKVTVIKY